MIFLTIKKRVDFLAIGKNNTCFYSPSILLLAQKTPSKYLASPQDNKINSFCRVGYTVSKAIGNAVKRNLVKRRFRAAFSQLYLQYGLEHYDYVLLARKTAADADYKKIYADLKFCFSGVSRLIKANNSQDGKRNEKAKKG